MIRNLLATVATAGLLAAAPAYAEILFELGNNPQDSEVNVFFQNGETGFTLTDGEAGQNSGIPVNFTTLGNPLQQLHQASAGNAQILCESNCIDNSAVGGPNATAQLGSISMRAGFGFDWGDAIINLENGVGTALVTVTDNFGEDFEYLLGTGQNFLTMVAQAGERITRIDVTNANPGDPFGFTEFKQPRVSDVQAVPAPLIGHSIWLLGMIGAVMGGQRLPEWLRRRKQAA